MSQPLKNWYYKLESYNLFLRCIFTYVYSYVAVCGYVGMQVPRDPKRVSEPLKAGVIGSCEPPCVRAGN